MGLYEFPKHSDVVFNQHGNIGLHGVQNYLLQSIASLCEGFGSHWIGLDYRLHKQMNVLYIFWVFAFHCFYLFVVFFIFIILFNILQITCKLSSLTVVTNSTIWILNELAGKEWNNFFCHILSYFLLVWQKHLLYSLGEWDRSAGYSSCMED